MIWGDTSFEKLCSRLPAHEGAAGAPQARRPLHEAEEREDPRNALLDAFDAHLDALVRHELVPQLESRLRRLMPALAAKLAPTPPPATGIDPLEAAAVLTTLKLADGLRLSREHRALFDAARAIVLRWARLGRPARRVACDPPPPQPAAAFLIDDAGGGQ